MSLLSDEEEMREGQAEAESAVKEFIRRFSRADTEEDFGYGSQTVLRSESWIPGRPLTICEQLHQTCCSSLDNFSVFCHVFVLGNLAQRVRRDFTSFYDTVSDTMSSFSRSASSEIPQVITEGDERVSEQSRGELPLTAELIEDDFPSYIKHAALQFERQYSVSHPGNTNIQILQNKEAKRERIIRLQSRTDSTRSSVN